MKKTYEENLVSVITPVYNSSKYLSKMINSVMHQSYKKIEIILVDDCSTDNSANIIQKFQKKYKNIIYFKQEKNLGAGFARNKALELAKGRYVAFLDSDDVWKENKIELQLKLMSDTGSPFSYTAIEMIDSKDNLIKSKRNIKERCSYNYLLKNTIIATSSVVVDRKLLGDFRMHLRRGGQDYATWLKLLRNDVVAVGINEALTQYRIVENSLSSNKFKSIKQVWEIQTQEEKINKFFVLYNEICFIINALKKYLL